MLRRSGVVGVGVGVAIISAVSIALLAASTPTPERGGARSQRAPLGVPIGVVQNCERDAGLGGSAPVTSVWRDQSGLHVRIGLGSQYAVGSALTVTESTLLACLEAAPGAPERYPTDSGGLLLLWKYSSTVLWPCLEQHGVQPGTVPSRATFLRGDPLELNPFIAVATHLGTERARQLGRECPAVPSYLIESSG